MSEEQPESSAALKTNSDLPGESVVEFDLQCLDCDYNLRTLPITARCPECGKPVTETFHGNSLHLADPVWLRRVRNGITLAAWTIPSGVVFNVLWTIFTYDRFFFEGRRRLGFCLGNIVVSVLIIKGVFGVTALEPSRSQVTRGASVRALCRWLCVTSGVLWSGIAFLDRSPEERFPTPPPWAHVSDWLQGTHGSEANYIRAHANYMRAQMKHMWTFSEWSARNPYQSIPMFSSAVSLFLLMLHLRRIARRGRVNGLVKCMTVLLWGLPALGVMYGVIINEANTPSRGGDLSFLKDMVVDGAMFLWLLICLPFVVLGVVAMGWFRRMLSAELQQRPDDRARRDFDSPRL